MLRAFTTCIILGIAAPAFANCGGSFDQFINGLKAEAVERGASRSAANAFFQTARHDPKVIKQDRSQSVFRQSFNQFASRVVSAHRMRVGGEKWQELRPVFERAQRAYGVPAPVILAFWAMETDFGVNQGSFNTLNALVTLAHDCRRPELFRPQIFAALELWQNGTFDPATAKGAWAGEIGMVQMLPADVLGKGVDGNGDGQVDLVNTPADAIMTAARVLSSHGWQANQPWLQEVRLDKSLDWAQTGLDSWQSVSQWRKAGVRARAGDLPNGNLDAALLLPQGHKGPAFLVYENFNVYFEWNKSLVNVTTAAYFATRLGGAERFNLGNPDPELSFEQMTALQTKLQTLGHDVGSVDGILGVKTRKAVQIEQAKRGLPADAWPTVALIDRL